MRIWYLPPRFLTNKLLKEEYENSRIALETAPDEFKGYYYLRLIILEKEMLSRNRIPDKIWSVEYQPSDYTLDKCPTEHQVYFSIMKLIELYRNSLADKECFDYFDTLTSADVEDIWLESQWTIELYRKEFCL